MVREFCRHMGWHTADKPEHPNVGLVDVFMHKLREEVGELADATGNTSGKVDFVEVVDALRDIEYLLHGFELLFGVTEVANSSFLEVHYSNMTKCMQNGVVTKPPDFKKPDILSVLRKVFPKQQLLFRS